MAAVRGHTSLVLGHGDAALLFRRAFEGEFSGVFQHMAFAITDWSAERQFIGPFETAFANWR